MDVDWFRNTTWNEDIERAFDEKLRRARRKEQYLRIQACTLAGSHPEVALKLLDRNFELGDNYDRAQAYVDRANALLTLSLVEEALESYEAALTREASFPNVKTQAYINLPYIIAIRGMHERYKRALELLNLYKSRLMFPIDRFRWHTAHALIASATGKTDAARHHAERALEAASFEHSGLRYHASLGLVSSQYDEVIRKLEALCVN